jgi:hypothetical protein
MPPVTNPANTAFAKLVSTWPCVAVSGAAGIVGGVQRVLLDLGREAGALDQRLARGVRIGLVLGQDVVHLAGVGRDELRLVRVVVGLRLGVGDLVLRLQLGDDLRLQELRPDQLLLQVVLGDPVLLEVGLVLGGVRPELGRDRLLQPGVDLAVDTVTPSSLAMFSTCAFVIIRCRMGSTTSVL